MSATDDWSNYEQKSQQQLKEAEKLEEKRNELNPKRRILHKIFILYSIIVAITAVLLGIGNFLVVFYEDIGDKVNDALSYIISTYLLLFTFTVIMVELEWTKFIAKSKILMFWVSRGIIYIFIGVLSLSQNRLYGSSAPFGDEYVNILSYLIMSLGIGYTVMGVLCFQIILKRYRADYQARRLAADGNESSPDLELT